MFGTEIFGQHLFAYGDFEDDQGGLPPDPKPPGTWIGQCPDTTPWDNIPTDIVDTEKCYVNRKC